MQDYIYMNAYRPCKFNASDVLARIDGFFTVTKDLNETKMQLATMNHVRAAGAGAARIRTPRRARCPCAWTPTRGRPTSAFVDVEMRRCR